MASDRETLRELEREEVRAVLGSKLFLRSPSLASLLSYLCDKCFDGHSDQIKEFTIAVEHFNRVATDFQSKHDPIVRVQSNRLRQRLRRFYRTDGRGRDIAISIPAGGYAPVFHHKKDEPPREEAQALGPIEESLEAPVPRAPGLSAVRETGHVEHQPVGRSSPGVQALLPVILLLVILGLLVLLVRRSPDVGTAAAKTGSVMQSAYNSQPHLLPETDEAIRILAGSAVDKSVDRQGRVWSSDRFFTGGLVHTPLPAALIRADDLLLCRTARVGDFRYDIPLKPGVYELHLYFAEMKYGIEPDNGGESTRRFNVFANDQIILRDFDIICDAAGSGIVTEKVFIDIGPSDDGFLHLVFDGVANEALLSGLEVLPGIPGKIRPIRISTRATSYISADESVWEPDHYFRGGQQVSRLHRVAGTTDSELYQGERYGHFSYSIPVIPGRYRVMLKFSETYFGPKNFGGTGVGFRVFNVHCNGVMLLKSFDIAKEAGGENRAVDKVFNGIEANPQDKVLITFEPVKNYACVNAIEVVPE